MIPQVSARLAAGEILTIMEPRRTGKTSVALAALQNLAGDRARIGAVALTRFPDPAQAAAALDHQLATAPRRVARTLRSMMRIFDRETIAGIAGDEASADVTLATEVVAAATRGSSDLPTLLAGTGEHAEGAVLLDEAHAMLDWPPALRQSLNAVLRDRPRLGVVITSSDIESLRRLTERGGPLHLVGSRITLPAITPSQWQPALLSRFHRLEIDIPAATLADLIASTDGHPYLTMRLARDCARLPAISPGRGSPAIQS